MIKIPDGGMKKKRKKTYVLQIGAHLARCERWGWLGCGSEECENWLITSDEQDTRIRQEKREEERDKDLSCRN